MGPGMKLYIHSHGVLKIHRQTTDRNEVVWTHIIHIECTNMNMTY